MLSVPALTGRLPSADDADGAQTAVVTSSFALANWNSTEPGGTLDVENRRYTVIGIVNDTYAFPEDAAVWITGPTNGKSEPYGLQLPGNSSPEARSLACASQRRTWPNTRAGQTFSQNFVAGRCGWPGKDDAAVFATALGGRCAFSAGSQAFVCISRARFTVEIGGARSQ
ncbi:MAG: ABC transporter permease [Acidobacteriaceae bacterium]|nr:ABC transporter permease [Acidobacteriaceae bacterium]